MQIEVKLFTVGCQGRAIKHQFYLHDELEDAVAAMQKAEMGVEVEHLRTGDVAVSIDTSEEYVDLIVVPNVDSVPTAIYLLLHRNFGNTAATRPEQG